MARCFSMPQIIHLVCHGIRKEGAVESKEVLARLARVSRIWSDVALDCLWYHIRGIDTLIRCMPQDLWSSSDSEGFTLLRPFKPSDLQILEKYASRVRIFYSDKTDWDIPRWVQQALFLSAQHPILPNLRQLDWTSCQNDCITLVRFFLGEKLRVLALSIDIIGMEQVYFLGAIPVLCPAISRLELSLRSRVGDVDLAGQIQDFSATLCEWRALVTLVIRDTTLDGLLCIAVIPNLKTLEIGDAKSLWKPSQSQARNLAGLFNDFHKLESPFPALRSLKVKTGGPVLIITNLFLFYKNAKLSQFTVVLGSASDTQDDLEGLFLALAEHCDHTSLKSITLHHSQEHLYPDLLTFQPLFQFSALQSFVIEGPWSGYRLIDSKEDIEQMVSAWPDLRVLRITPDANIIFFSVTLLKLLSLAKFAKLRHLALPLDASCNYARKKIRGNPEKYTGMVNRSLRTLTVNAKSTISHKEFVAEFLAEVFPNLDDIRVCVLEGQGDEDARRWRYVARVLLPLLGGVRREFSEGPVPLKNSAREWAGKVENLDGDWSDEENLGKSLDGIDVHSYANWDD